MLESLLKNQAGVVTTQQMLALGMSRGVIMRRAKQWSQPCRGLYLSTPPTFESALWAGWLRGGPEAAIGEEAAAFRWGILDEVPKAVTVWAESPRTNFHVDKWAVQFRRAHRESRRTPGLTLVEDTLLDIAHVRAEVPAVAAVLRGFADGFTTGERLAEKMRQRPRQRHRELLQQLCSEPGLESVLEFLFLRNVVDAHGLPRPTLQAQRCSGRVDSRYGEYGLLLELDGGRYHRDKSRDFIRDNDHILEHAEKTLHFGWSQANEGACRAAAQVARGLMLGGWDGSRRRVSCHCLSA